VRNTAFQSAFNATLALPMAEFFRYDSSELVDCIFFTRHFPSLSSLKKQEAF